MTTTIVAVGPLDPGGGSGTPPIIPILGGIFVIAFGGALVLLRPDQAGFVARVRAMGSAGAVTRSRYGRRRAVGQWMRDLPIISALGSRSRLKGPSMSQRVKTSSLARSVKKPARTPVAATPKESWKSRLKDSDMADAIRARKAAKRVRAQIKSRKKAK
ncbi:MAG: hypothetical protein IIC71_00665 [Acidobacteria bacterium]|nr:hypothetical protein [Acidobacteriota bacterium]